MRKHHQHYEVAEDKVIHPQPNDVTRPHPEKPHVERKAMTEGEERVEESKVDDNAEHKVIDPRPND
eukprot:11325149-Prorocentrum_lima.AAC.1